MILLKLAIMGMMLKGSLLGGVDMVADNVPHFEKVAGSKAVATEESWKPSRVGIIPDLSEACESVTDSAITLDMIDSHNYYLWVKKERDTYGSNKGDDTAPADDDYTDGEELFYNDGCDHWNVWKVYDKAYVDECRSKAEQPEESEVQ